MNKTRIKQHFYAFPLEVGVDLIANEIENFVFENEMPLIYSRKLSGILSELLNSLFNSYFLVM